MPLGSISELPADSCREIKASEGDKAVNGWYWLTTPGSHHVSLSYCLMKTGKKFTDVTVSFLKIIFVGERRE